VAVSWLMMAPGALAGDCVNVSSGEPVGCNELGAVTQEVYNESTLRDDASGAGDASSGTPWGAIAAAIGISTASILLLGGGIMWSRRRRERHAREWRDHVASSPGGGAAGVPPGSPANPEGSAERPVADLVAIAERARTEQQGQSKPAGWYPDPGQVKTQRYWTGSEWTEQRAPLEVESRNSLQFGAILVMVGAGAAIIGLFLPWMDASALSPIQENTLIQSAGGSWLALAGAIAAAGSAWATRASTTRNWTGVILGALITGYAVLFGTGERLELFNEAGRKVADGTPGVGLFVVGAGGLFVLIGSWREDS